METILIDEKEIDEEWVELIIEALNLGISVDEIRDFFSHPSRSKV